MKLSGYALTLVFHIFLEAESCDKLLQSNPHAANGTYQIAVNYATAAHSPFHSMIFPVSIFLRFLSKTYQETVPFATMSLQNYKREFRVE